MGLALSASAGTAAFLHGKASGAALRMERVVKERERLRRVGISGGVKRTKKGGETKWDT